MWEGHRTPLMSLTRLERPIEEGGIGLLDIKARNKVIEITWVRAFMDLSTY